MEENAVINERNLKRSKRKKANNDGKERSQLKKCTINDTADTDEGNSENERVNDNSDTANV